MPANHVAVAGVLLYMDATQIKTKFEKLGARATIRPLVRDGGIMVCVCRQHPNGLKEDEYRKLLLANPAAGQWRWQTMVRDPVVYVRGKITHSDHATIRLDGWHRVEMNTENRSRAMASVAFLD